MDEDEIKSALVENIEQLSEICKGSLTHSDQSLGLQSVKAINRILCHYIKQKEDDLYGPAWYVEIDRFFLGSNQPVIDDLKIKRYWFEYKILQEYESILQHFLGKNSKIAYQIAINTTELGELFIKNMDLVELDLIRRYFNTFLRRCIEARQIQTTVDFLYQYYLFLKKLIEAKLDDPLALKISTYFKYYGQYAVRMNLDYILEFSSYFLRLINEFAFHHYGRESVMVESLLDLFLTVDDFPEKEFTEKVLLGVRQNQVILATFYLLHEEELLAKKIYLDMKDESLERLHIIRKNILEENEQTYFEIDNIGINTLYINEDRKRKVLEFFRFFDL